MGGMFWVGGMCGWGGLVAVRWSGGDSEALGGGGCKKNKTRYDRAGQSPIGPKGGRWGTRLAWPPAGRERGAANQGRKGRPHAGAHRE